MTPALEVTLLLLTAAENAVCRGAEPTKRKLGGKPTAGIHGKAIPNDLLFGSAIQVPKIIAGR